MASASPSSPRESRRRPSETSCSEAAVSTRRATCTRRPWTRPTWSSVRQTTELIAQPVVEARAGQLRQLRATKLEAHLDRVLAREQAHPLAVGGHLHVLGARP